MPRVVYHHELELLQRELVALGRMAEEAVHRAVWALQHRALSEAQALIRDDDRIDAAAIAVEEHALRLVATQAPVASELRLVRAAIHGAHELERIADHAEGIAVLVLRCAELAASELPADFAMLAQESRAMLKASIDAIETMDAGASERLYVRDNTVDALYARVFHELLDRMRADATHVQAATYYLWVAHNLERIADRAVNIAEYIETVASGSLARAHRRVPPAAPVPDQSHG